MTAAPPGTPPGPAGGPGYPDPAGHGAGQGWADPFGDPAADPLTAPLPPGPASGGGGYGYPGGAGQSWYPGGAADGPAAGAAYGAHGGRSAPGGHRPYEQDPYGADGQQAEYTGGYEPPQPAQGAYGTAYAPDAPSVAPEAHTAPARPYEGHPQDVWPPAPRERRPQAPGPYDPPEPRPAPAGGDAYGGEGYGDDGYGDPGYPGGTPDDDGPGGYGEDGYGDDRYPDGGAPGGDAKDGDDDTPVTGGRAERRKAARRGGGRRRPQASPAEAAAGDEGAAAAPASRIEARRAAKAARTSPGMMVSQIVGELFITFGVLMLLFVVYQLWYTNVLADEQTSGATNSLQNAWASDTKDSSDAGEPNAFKHGTDFAIIYIPKLDVKAPIAEGIDKESILDKGDVGHYDGSMETAMPWAKSGNFALAGHRNTHGEPFRYINKLVAGDKVVVETKGMYYTYAVTSMLPSTSPSNVGVIQPVPQGSGFTGPGRYITLTTCTPEFTSEFRLIVWGKMVAEQPRTKGMPPALLGG